MKYRMFLATFTRITDTKIGDEYEVMVLSDDGNADYETTDKVFDDPAEALVAASTMDCAVKPLIVKRPKIRQRMVSVSEAFATESGGYAWGRNRQETWCGSQTHVHVEPVTMDEDDIEEMEHNPVYTVTLEVKTVKRFEVEIDTEYNDTIEDEFDAQRYAESQFEDGEYDHELKMADVWDDEVEAIDVEEN